MERISFKLALGLVLLAVGCGSNEVDHRLGGRGDTYQYAAPLVSAESPEPAVVTIQWSAVADAEGYRVFYGEGDFDGTDADKGRSGEIVTSERAISLEWLSEGAEYQIAVTAFGPKGFESRKSATVRVTVKEHGALQVPQPQVYPPSGSYEEGTKVSMSCSDPFATIRYTTNGDIPTITSTPYNPAAKPDVEEATFKVRAFRNGFDPSPPAQRTYTITPDPEKVETPTFSHGEGSYDSPLTVTITSATQGSTIHYALDNSALSCSTSPSVPSGQAFDLTLPATVRAIACKENMDPSSEASVTYWANGPGTVSDPVFSVPSGSYGSPLAFTITSATAGSTIHYKTDSSQLDCGTSPFIPSGSELTLTLPKTVRAIACKDPMTPSGVTSVTYQKGTVAAPQFTPLPGLYEEELMLTLTLTSTTPDVTFYYTIGHHPTPPADPVCGGSPGYLAEDGVVEFWFHGQSHILKAIACKSGWFNSGVTQGLYAIEPVTVAAPVFNPPGSAGPFVMPKTVTIGSATPGATIRYTINSSPPTCSSGTIGTSVTLTGTSTLKAIACMTGMIPSGVVQDNYTQSQVAAPYFSPPANQGPFMMPLVVTISSATPGATIRYTVNSSPPTCSSGTVGTSVTLTGTSTLRAVACKSGYAISNLTTGEYHQTQVALPVFDPIESHHSENEIVVTITTDTEDATIYYMIGTYPVDPVDPECDGSPGIWANPDGFTVNLHHDHRIMRAIACKAGYAPSIVTEKHYWYGNPT